MEAKKRDKILTAICKLISQKKSFFLTGHQRPDGDTVASELAMGSLLRRLGKKVEIYNYEPLPKSLSFLPGAKKVRSAHRLKKKYDAAFVFECFDANRMGNIIDLKKQVETVVNIDHHLKHSNFGHINLIDPKASSNSEQLYYLYEKLGILPTQEEASCLYVGLMTDTGRFQYSNTTAETMRVATKLLERGVRVHELCEEIYGTRTFSALKLLGSSLSKLELFSSGKIAYIEITREDFKNAAASEDETEEVVNYGLMIPGALISILARQELAANSRGFAPRRATRSSENHIVKISLRSKEDVNVCKLAEQFGGGGHMHASGCKIPGTIRKVSGMVLKAAQKLISSNHH